MLFVPALQLDPNVIAEENSDVFDEMDTEAQRGENAQAECFQ